MERQELADKIKQLVVEMLGCPADEVTPEAKLVEDLNADSLDLFDLVMTVEEEFEIAEIADEKIEALVTVEDLVALVAEALKATA